MAPNLALHIECRWTVHKPPILLYWESVNRNQLQSNRRNLKKDPSFYWVKLWCKVQFSFCYKHPSKTRWFELQSKKSQNLGTDAYLCAFFMYTIFAQKDFSLSLFSFVQFCKTLILVSVHRTCAETAAVSRGTSHVSAVSTPLRWIFKTKNAL